MFEILWRMLVIGIGGTAILDVWALILKAGFGIALPNWALVGRWFAHLGKGVLVHDDIAKAPAIANELSIGWLAHYAVGILYAAILIWFAGPAWLQSPTILPALLVGLVTVAAGWFILQPGMGAGIAASKRPNPWMVRMLNIVAHSLFGLGLYVTARLIA